MNREKAMGRYKEEVEVMLREYRIHMAKHIQERAEDLESMVKGAMDELGSRMEAQQKEYVSFLFISALKTDLIQRNYQFLLHAMDLRWYLDDESIEVYFSAGALFEPWEQLWDRLIEKSHAYRGAVNLYDIQHILFGELEVMDAVIALILRYQLRDWEKKGIFSKVTLPPYWLLKWGEYRDQMEFILHTDRGEKDESVWKGELKKAVHKPETMVFSYWYRVAYRDYTMKELDMRFMVFEESNLEGMAFHGCNLEGARFSKCTMTDCSFEGCRLWGADFTGCTLKGVSFQNADLTNAILPAPSLPFLNLTPEQLQLIGLAQEEEE